LGARVEEIPLKFQLRESGASKIEPQTAKDILKTVILLRWHDEFTQKFFKFGVVGLVGFVINFVGFRIFKTAFRNLPINVSLVNGLSNAIAAEMAIISNFIFNNLWTFAKEKITSLNLLL